MSSIFLEVPFAFSKNLIFVKDVDMFPKCTLAITEDQYLQKQREHSSNLGSEHKEIII